MLCRLGHTHILTRRRAATNQRKQNSTSTITQNWLRAEPKIHAHAHTPTLGIKRLFNTRKEAQRNFPHFIISNSKTHLNSTWHTYTRKILERVCGGKDYTKIIRHPNKSRRFERRSMGARLARSSGSNTVQRTNQKN